MIEDMGKTYKLVNSNLYILEFKDCRGKADGPSIYIRIYTYWNLKT